MGMFRFEGPEPSDTQDLYNNRVVGLGCHWITFGYVRQGLFCFRFPVKEQSRLEKEPFQLAYTPVQLINDQLVLSSLLDDGIQDVKLEGVCLLTSKHMIEEARRICKGGRLGSGLTLVSDWTYKIGCSGHLPYTYTML